MQEQFIFWRDEKQIAKAEYCQLLGMYSSSEHFNIIFELLFVLCWLVKCLSNNWFIKKSFYTWNNCLSLFLFVRHLIIYSWKHWTYEGWIMAVLLCAMFLSCNKCVLCVIYVWQHILMCFYFKLLMFFSKQLFTSFCYFYKTYENAGKAKCFFVLFSVLSYFLKKTITNIST